MMHFEGAVDVWSNETPQKMFEAACGVGRFLLVCIVYIANHNRWSFVLEKRSAPFLARPRCVW